MPYRYQAILNPERVLEDHRKQKLKRETQLKALKNMPVPDFDAVDTAGIKHRPSDYRGRVLVLYFWGFWNHSFESEIPHLNKIIEKYEKNGLATLSFVDISILKDEKEHLIKNPVRFPIVENADKFTHNFLPLDYISTPFFIIVDKQGNMQYFYVDRQVDNFNSAFYKEDGFEAQILSLLK